MDMALQVKKMVVGPLEENCYIVYEENGHGECFLVDPGASGNMILRQLESLHLTPAACLLTHGHFDHIMAVEWIRKQYPEMTVTALDKEREVLEDPEKSLLRAFGGKFPTENIRFVPDGTELFPAQIPVKVMATPGHTVGSTGYYLEGPGILFSGDTLFLEGAGRTDLPTGSTEAIVSSIKEKLMALPDDTKVYPGHGDETTIAHEKKYNYMVVMG